MEQIHHFYSSRTIRILTGSAVHLRSIFRSYALRKQYRKKTFFVTNDRPETQHGRLAPPGTELAVFDVCLEVLVTTSTTFAF
jgi:hypothetical protein